MKTVLITGAAKGIGRQVAQELAAKGFHVFIGARKPEAGKAAVAAIADAGGKATFLALDVADSASVEAARADFSNHADHLDVLINNAAILADGESGILATKDDLLRRTLETNTLGPLRVTQAFQPLLALSSAPRIINISSGGGQLTDGADGWAPAYCISKAALNMVTSQLATALPKFAINSVCPGWVRTDMGGAGAPRSLEQGADTIVWLASGAPQDLTSQFLRDRQVIPW